MGLGLAGWMEGLGGGVEGLRVEVRVTGFFGDGERGPGNVENSILDG